MKNYKVDFVANVSDNDIFVFGKSDFASFDTFQSDPNKPFCEFGADILDKVEAKMEKYYETCDAYDRRKNGGCVDIKSNVYTAVSEVENILENILNEASVASGRSMDELWEYETWHVVNMRNANR